MKYLILAGIFSFSAQALAIAECAGRASDGSFVLVQINTTGAVGLADEGMVTIERDGNRFGYKIAREDIAQFFEYDDFSDSSAMVGLAAYVAKESPISIKYVGTNFVDMDLKAVVDGNEGSGSRGNFVRVWKGPGYASTDQFQLTKPVCSVWSNI